MSHWRNRSALVIRRAIIEGQAKGLTGAALRKFVSERYPFGARANHPYKIWCDEMARQLGASPAARKRHQAKIDAWNKKVGQGELFTKEEPT